VLTEISDNVDRARLRGWVLYDASCPFCLRLLARFEDTLRAGGFRAEPLQSPWVRDRLNLPEDQLLVEMHVLTRHGRVLGGADALVYLANQLRAAPRPWWAWLLAIASRMPLAMPVLRRAYAGFAARRHCRSGACSLGKTQSWEKEEMP